jgi:hypothetical protein
VAKEKLADDLPVLLGRSRQESAVEADDRPKRSAEARKLDDGRAAHAEADGREPAAVDRRLGGESVEARLEAAMEQRTVGPKRLAQRHGAVEGRILLPIHIERESNVTELGETDRLVLGVPSEPAALVGDQYARRRTSPRAVGEIAGQDDIVVCEIADGAKGNHRDLSRSRIQGTASLQESIRAWA